MVSKRKTVDELLQRMARVLCKDDGLASFEGSGEPRTLEQLADSLERNRKPVKTVRRPRLERPRDPADDVLFYISTERNH